MRHPFVATLVAALLLPAAAVAAPENLARAGADSAITAAVNALKVSQAYVPEAPPTAKVMAGFLVLENPTVKPLTLTGATSPQFARVSLHETKKQNGLARMSAVDELAVPPKERVSFVPGGLHFMLYEPKQPLKVGDQVTLVLQFAGGDQRRITLPVRPRGQHGGHGHHGHHH